MLWTTEPTDNAYNVYRGSLIRLRNSGVYTQTPTLPLAGRWCNLAPGTLPFVDATTPPAGQVMYYLVTLRGLTFEGTLGQDSEGYTRPNTQPCP